MLFWWLRSLVTGVPLGDVGTLVRRPGPLGAVAALVHRPDRAGKR